MAATPGAPASPRGSKPKVFLNAGGGSAKSARKTLEEAGLEVEEVQPQELEERLKATIKGGAKRLVVAGGDGTIATAAALVADTDVELAIIPAGTLNHFAKDHNIPTDFGDAALVAQDAVTAEADAGYINDRLFLNTSALGAYVTFVRDRERFEKKVGYRIASLLALVKTWRQLRSFSVTFEVDGEVKSYRTSLVFIGVGERELKVPMLGGRVKKGKHALHVMIVKGGKRSQLVALAFAAMAKGTKEASKLQEFDSFMVDHCQIELHRSHTLIGLDGEVVQVRTPLEYKIARGTLRIVVAPPEVSE